MMIPWDDVLSRLDLVGATLSQTAAAAIEFSWPLAVRNAFTTGLVMTLVSLAILIGLGFFIRFVNRMEEEDAFLPEWVGPTLCVGYLLIPVAIAVLVFGLIIVLNPEWHALTSLIDLLKS